MSGRVDEKTTALYTGQLVDELNANILLTDIATITLTLYDTVTGVIINSRSKQNIKNTNNVTISATGLVSWTLQPADNIILDNTLPSELHTALFEGTYGASKEFHHNFNFRVVNLNKVP